MSQHPFFRAPAGEGPVKEAAAAAAAAEVEEEEDEG